MNAKQIADIIAYAPQQVEQAMHTATPRKAAVIVSCDLLERSDFCSIATTLVWRSLSFLVRNFGGNE